MSIQVVCTGCETELKVPDTASGKLVKCPNCETRTKVPAPVAEQIDDDETPRPKPKVKAARPTVSDDSDDEDDRPRKKPRRARDDDDEEEDDDRPRTKKSKSKAKSGSNKVLILVLAGVGGLILLGGGVGAAWYFMKGTDQSKPVIPSAKSAPVVAKTITPHSEFLIKPEPSKPGGNAHVRDIELSPDGGRMLVKVMGGPSQLWELTPAPKMIETITKGDALGLVNQGEHVLVSDGLFDLSLVELKTGNAIPGSIEGSWRHGDYGMSVSNKFGRFSWEGRHVNWERKPFRVSKLIKSNDTEKAVMAHPDSLVIFAPPIDSQSKLFFGDPKTGTIKVFDFETMKVTKEIKIEAPKGPGRSDAEWHTFAVRQDGRRIAIRLGWVTGSVEIYDESGKAVNSSNAYLGSGHAREQFLGQERLFFTVGLPKSEKSEENKLGVYDYERSSFVGFILGPKGESRLTAASEDGRTVVMYYIGRPSCIFDLTQLK
jgi:LSD1 subclass zinc finger protein